MVCPVCSVCSVCYVCYNCTVCLYVCLRLQNTLLGNESSFRFVASSTALDAARESSFHWEDLFFFSFFCFISSPFVFLIPPFFPFVCLALCSCAEEKPTLKKKRAESSHLEMSLFGSVGTTPAATAQNNTSGDISKDVALTMPPEDSISDLRFSPASEHLAVASWDKKVRIYEINEQGQSEGKALFEHEAPVLNCCWSPVFSPWHIIICMRVITNWLYFFACRMVLKSLVLEPIRLPVCSIFLLVLQLPCRSRLTMLPFDAVT